MASFSVVVVEPGDTDPSELLAAAIRRGDVSRAQDLLLSHSSGISPGFALLEAAFSGHRDMLELLLDTVGAASGGGRSSPPLLAPPADALGRQPIHFAAANGDYSACQLLLSRGADVNATTKVGLAPLHYAAAMGHRALCDLLLDAGAEVDLKDSGGATPLLLAAESGHAHCVMSMLRRQANVNAQDTSGVSPLLAALAQGHGRTAEALMDVGAQPSGTIDGRTALHWAAHHGMKMVLHRLLESASGTAEVDAEDEAGDTPLLLAARRGHQQAVEMLLSAGASDKANKSGVTPLIVSSVFGHEGVVKALLARGANTAACDTKQRRTALHWAAIGDEAAVVKVLLEHGADGSAVDGMGLTPMDLAVEHDSQQVVQIFVKTADGRG